MPSNFEVGKILIIFNDFEIKKKYYEISNKIMSDIIMSCSFNTQD